MNDQFSGHESYRALRLMSELEAGEAMSQRELAGRMGIAVGLVNSCLKHFIAKGYVRIKAFPRNRYAYLLTPKGFAEKSRLAYQHLNYFASLYTTTRRDYLELFRRLKAQGGGSVCFCGVDEVAEIAYLSLQEAGVELMSIADVNPVNGGFLGRDVVALEQLMSSCCPIVLSSLKRRHELAGQLRLLGAPRERIVSIDVTAPDAL